MPANEMSMTIINNNWLGEHLKAVSEKIAECDRLRAELATMTAERDRFRAERDEARTETWKLLKEGFT